MNNSKIPRDVDVQALLDAGPVGSLQRRAILFCGMVALLDGFDTQMIGVLAPSMGSALGIELARFGPIFSAALFGYMVGALVIGSLADRYGRKSCMLVSVLIFGVFTFSTAYATSFGQLLLLRFLAGLGLGGASPCFLALTTEYAPLKYRALFVSLLWASFPLGGVVGGFASAALIPAWGWESMFYVGGVIPLVLLFFMAPFMPESLRFLAIRDSHGARTRKVLVTLQPSLREVDYRIVGHDEASQGSSIGMLFSGAMALRTLLLWGAFFCTFCVLIAVGSWAPALLRNLGMPISKAAVVLAVYNIGGALGTVALGRLIDKFGAPRLLIAAFIVGALCLAPLGYAGESFGLLLCLIGAVGFSMSGAGGGLVVLAATLYPVASRGTGIGWALGIGRLGSVAGPLVGGLLLQQQWSMGELFLALCIPTLLAACFIGALVLARGFGRDEQPLPDMAAETA
ncbi:MAG: MFS transporter [Pseudomonadota bacterium]